MNKHSINTIGKKQKARDNAQIVYINENQDLKIILDNNFKTWEDIDSWDDFSAQEWVFKIAINVFKGKKVDICCDCCEYSYVSPLNFNDINNQKCKGVKIAFLVEKILNEIIIAKAIRENDGTYCN